MRAKQSAAASDGTVKKNKVEIDDPESPGLSSEEMEMEMDSPTSTTRRQNGSDRWRCICGSEKNMIGGGFYLPLHSQILRIRNEDSLVGEDTCPVLSLFVANEHNNSNKTSKVVLMSRPILPASPLSGKTANKRFAG